MWGIGTTEAALRTSLTRLALVVAGLLPVAGLIAGEAQAKEQRRTVDALSIDRVVLPAPFGDGRPVSIVVVGGKVTCIGAKCPVPPGVVRIDAGGKGSGNFGTALPGFFEAAAHIGQIEVSLEGSSHDGNVQGLDNAAHVRAVDGLHLDSRVVRAALRGGVTGALCAPRGAALVRGQSVMLSTAAKDVTSAVLQPTVAVHAQLGEGAKRHRGRPAIGARSGQVAVLRALLAEARARAGSKSARPWTLGGRSTLAGVEALVPVVQGKAPLVVHAHRAADILAALRLARDFGLRLVISGGAEAHVVRKQLAAQKVPVLLAPVIARPYGFDTARARPDNAALLHKAGVPLVLSTASTHNARHLRWQVGLAVRHGLPRAAALDAATRAAPRLFGVDAGGLAVGKRANFVVFTGDPLSLTGRVAHVVVGRSVLSAPRQR